MVQSNIIGLSGDLLSPENEKNVNRNEKYAIIIIKVNRSQS